MVPLSTVKWEDIRYGDKVVSAVNNPGVIYQKDESPDSDRRLIYIIWDNHKRTIQPQYLLDRVMWKGQ